MKKSFIFIVLACGFLNLSFAYEMHGSLNDNNDGTFEVNVVSTNGYEYTGRADQQGDGILHVDVAIQGRGSEIYLGIATPNPNGSYDLHLRNNTTGEIATGSLEKSS